MLTTQNELYIGALRAKGANWNHIEIFYCTSLDVHRQFAMKLCGQHTFHSAEKILVHFVQAAYCICVYNTLVRDSWRIMWFGLLARK